MILWQEARIDLMIMFVLAGDSQLLSIMKNNDFVLFVYIGISLLFMILVFTFFAKRRKRHELRYPQDLKDFRRALLTNDIENIDRLGSHIIWNESLTQENATISGYMECR